MVEIFWSPLKSSGQSIYSNSNRSSRFTPPSHCASAYLSVIKSLWVVIDGTCDDNSEARERRTSNTKWSKDRNQFIISKSCFKQTSFVKTKVLCFVSKRRLSVVTTMSLRSETALWIQLIVTGPGSKEQLNLHKKKCCGQGWVSYERDYCQHHETEGGDAAVLRLRLMISRQVKMVVTFKTELEASSQCTKATCEAATTGNLGNKMLFLCWHKELDVLETWT